MMNIPSECRTASIDPDHAMILSHDANPKPDGIFGKDRARRGPLQLARRQLIQSSLHSNSSCVARLVFRPFPVQKSRRGESIGRLSVGIFTSPVHDATAFTAGPGRPRPRPPPTRLHRASRPFPARRLHAGPPSWTTGAPAASAWSFYETDWARAVSAVIRCTQALI